ncbi:MAG TPA: hypothetical protein VGR07_23640 [Thermoanaerobaculia bacterium]|nr:hypothetical protein [Thermoanaerobaculia bacterium]
MAALRGESLKELFTDALQTYLERETPGASSQRGWRSVFGQARPEEVETIDAIVSQEFERVEPDEWR